MIITFGVGIEEIKFGLVPSEVIEIWGEPDQIKEDEREDFVVYYYNEKMTKLYFYSEWGDKLVTIYITNPRLQVWNQKVIGTKKMQIERMLDENGIQSKVYDDYDMINSIFCEEIWSIFGFEYERLTTIEFSVLEDENGNGKWPLA
ncbi:MAG: hypothetical protein Q4F21_14695 [Lachnospiraceae bacterium]|nr:hypothetical protein [Lachnospiraceae bacterium]